MRFGGVPYYGWLVYIIEINYRNVFSFIFFKCMWANITISREAMSDEFRFTSVSFAHLF